VDINAFSAADSPPAPPFNAELELISGLPRWVPYATFHTG
jgi:hypothetical protein